jgi:16S rRNA (guanine1207-N2)-methyltransferase
MYSGALNTLFQFIEQNPATIDTAKRIFMPRALYHPGLTALKDRELFLSQTFRPLAAHLEVYGFHVTREIPSDVDLVLFTPTRQKKESLYWMACGLLSLREGGLFICAAENQLGAKSYRKELFALFSRLGEKRESEI